MPDQMQLPPGATLEESPAAMKLPPGAELETAAPPAREPSFGERLRAAKNPGVSEGAGLAGGLAEWEHQSGGELSGGIRDILSGNVAQGVHRIIGGLGNVAAPAAALAGPAAAAAAPAATATSIGGGVLGGMAGKSIAQGVGATPAQSELAGDVGSLAGGYAGSELSNAVMGVGRRALLLGRSPESAYKSALKPPTVIDSSRAIQTGLREGIPVSKSGLEELYSRLNDLQGEVSKVIATKGQNVTVDPNRVAGRLGDTVKTFSQQVNPNADLTAIGKSGMEFLQNNPNPIPASQAQQMKIGTYQRLGDKAYGEIGSAQREAQKALARGLKEELARQIPELSQLNKKESDLFDLQGVLERAVNRIGNHQIMGIGTPIAAGAARTVTGSNKVGAAVGIMKAVLDDPFVKSRLAIALSAHGNSLATANAKILALANSLGRAAVSPGSEQSPNPEKSE